MRTRYQRGKGFSFGVVLRTAGATAVKSDPTLATGDVKISLDGGAFANIEGGGTFTDYVNEVPTGGKRVQVTVDDTQTASKEIVIIFFNGNAGHDLTKF